MNGIQKFKLARRGASPSASEPRRTPPAVTQGIAKSDPAAAAMEQAAADVPRLLTPQQVAEMLGLTERTLERWRITGEGPRYSKLSRSTVRYLPDDVAAFVNGRMRANTAQ